MDKNLQTIEDLFFSALENNEEEIPSTNVWEAIDIQLDKEHLVSIKRKYIYAKRIAFLLLFLLISISLYEIENANTTGENAIRKYSKEINKNISKDSTGTGIIKKNKTFLFNSTAKKNTGNYKKNKKGGQSSLNSVTSNDYKKPIEPQPEKINLPNDISKNQPFSNSIKNPHLTSRPFSKVTIRNRKSTEEGEPFVNRNESPVYYQIPTSKNQIKTVTEYENWRSEDSVNLKYLSRSITMAASKISNPIQKSIVKTVPKKRGNPVVFSITPFFSPDIAWYYLKNDHINNQSSNANEIENEETHEFSFTYGALVDYRINKHWGLQSGITLSNTNIFVQPETIYAQPDNSGNIKYRINSSSGYGYVLPSFSPNPAAGDSLYTLSTSHLLQYIGIPLAATYSISRGKFKINVLVGLSGNFLTKASLKTTVEKGADNSIETIENLKGPKKLYFSGLTGLGIDYRLNKNVALNFSPTMRFALNPINRDATVKSYPTSMGSVIGLKIGL